MKEHFSFVFAKIMNRPSPRGLGRQIDRPNPRGEELFPHFLRGQAICLYGSASDRKPFYPRDHTGMQDNHQACLTETLPDHEAVLDIDHGEKAKTRQIDHQR